MGPNPGGPQEPWRRAGIGKYLGVLSGGMTSNLPKQNQQTENWERPELEVGTRGPLHVDDI